MKRRAALNGFHSGVLLPCFAMGAMTLFAHGGLFAVAPMACLAPFRHGSHGIIQSELILNSSRTHSESLSEPSQDSFRIHKTVPEFSWVHTKLTQHRLRTQYPGKVFPQYELVPLELAGRIGTARTRRTNWYR